MTSYGIQPMILDYAKIKISSATLIMTRVSSGDPWGLLLTSLLILSKNEFEYWDLWYTVVLHSDTSIWNYNVRICKCNFFYIAEEQSDKNGQ